MKKKSQIYYSDSQANDNSEEDEVLFQEQANLEPFEQHVSKKKKMKGSYPMRINLMQIEQQCNQIMELLLKQQMKKTAKQIFQVLTQNWMHSDNSFIFAVNFKRNQEEDLRYFIQIMQEEFKYLHQKNAKKNNSKQKHQIHIVTLEKRSEVKDIALQLHIKGDLYQNNQERLHLFTVCKITNLSQKNLYCLQKNILPKKFCLFIPTFQNMRLNDGHGFNNQTQKYFYQVYSNRQLFIQFVFQCLISQSIKAYLPKEIITIISDFDFYPISYRQGCRRFIYALQKFQRIIQDKKMENTNFIDLSELVRLLNDTWRKVIGGSMGTFDFLQACQLINKQKFIKAIYDEDFIYTINQNMIQNALNLTKLFQSQKIEETQLYQKFQQKIKYKIQNHPTLKKHAKLFHSKQQKQSSKDNIKRRKPKDRSELLGFEKKTNYKTPKELFEDKVTKLIKQVSEDIRKQAKRVKWAELQFDERIKPQLVRIIAESAFEDREFQQAFDLLTSYSNVPLSKMMKLYQRQKQGYGKIIYILRSLQIMGLMQINKSQIRPLLMTNYYDKSQFRLK